MGRRITFGLFAILLATSAAAQTPPPCTGGHFVSATSGVNPEWISANIRDGCWGAGSPADCPVGFTLDTTLSPAECVSLIPRYVAPVGTDQIAVPTGQTAHLRRPCEIGCTGTVANCAAANYEWLASCPPGSAQGSIHSVEIYGFANPTAGTATCPVGSTAVGSGTTLECELKVPDGQWLTRPNVLAPLPANLCNPPPGQPGHDPIACAALVNQVVTVRNRSTEFFGTGAAFDPTTPAPTVPSVIRPMFEDGGGIRQVAFNDRLDLIAPRLADPADEAAPLVESDWNVLAANYESIAWGLPHSTNAARYPNGAAETFADVRPDQYFFLPGLPIGPSIRFRPSVDGSTNLGPTPVPSPAATCDADHFIGVEIVIDHFGQEIKVGEACVRPSAHTGGGPLSPTCLTPHSCDPNEITVTLDNAAQPTAQQFVPPAGPPGYTHPELRATFYRTLACRFGQLHTHGTAGGAALCVTPSTCLTTADSPNAACRGLAHCGTIPLPPTPIPTTQQPPCFEPSPTTREPQIEVIRPDNADWPVAAYQMGGGLPQPVEPTFTQPVKDQYGAMPRPQHFGRGPDPSRPDAHPYAFQGPPPSAWPDRIRVCIPGKSYPAGCADTSYTTQAACEAADEIWFPPGCMDVLPRLDSHKLTWMRGGVRVDMTTADTLTLADLSDADLAVRSDCAHSPNQYIDQSGSITTASILGQTGDPVATAAHCTSYDPAHATQADCETYGMSWIDVGDPLKLHNACAPESVTVPFPAATNITPPLSSVANLRLGTVQNLQII
ncbi:MAG: hypothetical protein F4Z82_15930 [Caldilineaceae bacterium SB0668_bin_21]|nr:hypothetical protein [Caldilineaceae bacterium SB0668_bin_21]